MPDPRKQVSAVAIGNPIDAISGQHNQESQ